MTWMLAAVLVLAGCKREAPEAQVAQEQPTQLVSAVAVSDEHASAQLTHGFHALENGWRWTASKFGLALASTDPAKSSQLELKLALPQAVFDRVGAVTLSATVNGKPLPSQTFSTAGKTTYTQEVPAGTFGAGPVTVEFTTDKSLPPGNGDARELALIVTSVALTSK